MTINSKPKITEEHDKYEAELRKNNPKISESKSKKSPNKLIAQLHALSKTIFI